MEVIKIDIFEELRDFIVEYREEFEEFLLGYSWESTKEPIYENKEDTKKEFEEIFEFLDEWANKHHR